MAPGVSRIACQVLRIASFSVTQLPAPNYHCRGGQATAVREMPARWWGHVAVDLKRQASAPGPALRIPFGFGFQLGGYQGSDVSHMSV